MKIVVTGSIAYDYLMSFPGRFTESLIAEQLENVSLSFLVDALKRQRGGNAPNIAYTLALLGGRPTVMATAGEDFTDYRAWLEANDVDTSAVVEIANESTSSFFVTTDQSHNQIATFYAGAMSHAGSLSFATHAADVELAIISPNDPGAMRAYVAECKQLGIPYIYDPSQQTTRLSADDLRCGLDGSALLVVNEYEYSLFLKKTGLAPEEIFEFTQGVLVTKGANGAWLSIDGQEYEIPVVPPQQVADPTGVGDAFRGGLMRGMQLGVPWALAGRMGALAATYVLENIGAQNHRFTRAEYVKRFRQHFDDQGALDALLG